MPEYAAFTKVKLENGWMSNMAHFPVTYEGKLYHTTEHLFQCLRFDDPEIQEEIMRPASPMAAKFAAKRHPDKMIVQPMSEQDLANMVLCIKLKLEQHPVLKELLLATGDNILVEDVSKRVSPTKPLDPNQRHTFWGMAFRNGVWEGHNQLGKFWMQFREELKNG